MVIGHERRREHSMDTSEGGHVTGVVQLPVAHEHIQGEP
jgi:hypothetical protein